MGNGQETPPPVPGGAVAKALEGIAQELPGEMAKLNAMVKAFEERGGKFTPELQKALDEIAEQAKHSDDVAEALAKVAELLGEPPAQTRRRAA